MPTYRQTPAGTGTVVATLPAEGTAPAQDIWEEVALENRDAAPHFTYFLLAKAGVPYRPGARRTGSA